MRLKKLEIQGYKSFANKSTFTFDDGITVVVGPNGSGKSNVSDAIRWVLGEQSYSTLRGHKTADMIFSGSSKRPGMGMAYATLVIDNSDGSLPIDFNEVTISRRAFRSGENEYLINNKRVRLKDVTELLSRGGLARQTYTVIGQGTIDQALSLRSDERRKLFEEAAGITYHRQRRAETLRRLQETHQNLVRLNDIVQEIEPRLKRLDRQVEKYEKHRQIRSHLDGLLKVWYGYQWGQGQSRLHQARVRATIGEENLKEQQSLLENLENRTQSLRAEQSELRSQLGDWHAQSSKLHNQAETLQRELAVGEERAHQLAAQREDLSGQIEHLEETLAQNQTQARELQSQLNQTEQNLHNTREKLKAAESQLNAYRHERETLLKQQTAAERKVSQLSQEHTETRSRLSRLAEREQELQAQQGEQAGLIEELQAQEAEQKAALTAAEAQVKDLQAKLQAKEAEEAACTARLQDLATTARDIGREMAQLEKQLASLRARQDVLTRLRNDMSGYFDGVRAVLQQDNLPGIRGTVSQLIAVPAELEVAFEAALGSRLQEIVVNRWADAEGAITYLKDSRNGRATFLPLDRVRPVSAADVPHTPGVIGLAADLVKFEADLEPAVSNLLNRVLVVEDIPSARAAFDVLTGGFQIVTLEGEIVRSGGSITGGESRKSRQQGGILAREREWRELPAQIEAVEAQLSHQQGALTKNSTAQAEEEDKLHDVQRQVAELGREIRRGENEVNQSSNRLAEIRNQIAWRRDLQKKAEADLRHNRERVQALEESLAKLAAERTTQQAAVAEFEEELANFSMETVLQSYNQAKTEVQLIEGQRENQRALLRNISQTQAQTESQLDSRRSRIKNLSEQRTGLVNDLALKEETHTELVAQVKVFTDKIEPVEATLEGLETEQNELETAVTQARQGWRRLEAEYNRQALELGRRQDEMEALRRQIEDDFGLVQLDLSTDQVGQPALPIHPIVTQLPTVETPPEGIEEDVRQLKVQLRQLGHINPDAPREHTEAQERYTFLVDQMTDLEQAASDLRDVVSELDKIMEAAFRETFEAVAKEFKNYFKLLFNGGEAQLTLTEPDDINETGVDIVARPPGKRLQNLELLSGGERSLTAQALIFALLKTSPTPYCVFDEVDAMLDEANVDRFREALQDLGQQIQFVVITHNRKTIEIASTIYGISMGDDAVSRVVSLKLDDLPAESSEVLVA